MKAPKISNWHTEGLPDSDITVFYRTTSDEYPVWVGFHDGEVWRTTDAEEVHDIVIGWLSLEEATAILDGHAEDLKDGRLHK